MKVLPIAPNPIVEPNVQHELYLEAETEQDATALSRLVDRYQIIGCGRDQESGDWWHVRLKLEPRQ